MFRAATIHRRHVHGLAGRCGVFAALAAAAIAVPAAGQNSGRNDPTPTNEWGARVYEERCVLCHGPQGAGDGRLPKSVAEYPDTNLYADHVPTDLELLKRAIVFGGSGGGAPHPLSPPWGDELTWSEIESVSVFTTLLRNDRQAGAALLGQQTAVPESELIGRELFESRCVLCHGPYGEGDGRMAKVIKDPPPFNLTLSAIPESFTREIVMEGGEAVGRSVQMPPWKDELTEREIDALLDFLFSIRRFGAPQRVSSDID